jgi:hypothetical protein
MILKILAWEVLTLCAVAIFSLGAREEVEKVLMRIVGVLAILICLTLAIGVALL